MAPPLPLEDKVLVDVQEEEEDPEEMEPWYPSSDSGPEPPTPPPALPLPEPEPVPPTPSLALPSPEPEPDQQPLPMTPAAVVERKGEGEEEPEAARHRWPGWPGTSVFRLVVPADKVGAVIGRRGETVRRLCQETRARVRVLDAAHDAASRIVLVSATEELESELPPAMNAAIKIFKHINEIEKINSDRTLSASTLEICSVRLLVPDAQAAHLIGKQGVTIKSIQESTGATIRIMDEDEVLGVESEDNERIVDILGAPLKVHNALKSVLELLWKFLVDHGVLHLFERKIQGGAQPLDTKENQVMDDYPLSVNQDFLLSEQ